MDKGTDRAHEVPGSGVGDVLTEVLKKGAERMLAMAIEAEVDAYVKRYADVRGTDGRRLVVRNGFMPERELETPIGTLSSPAIITSISSSPSCQWRCDDQAPGLRTT